MHKPRKRFGQNFLHDDAVIQHIVDCIQPCEGQSMVEIGPGEGALTKILLPMIKQMDLVELDRDLIPLLESSLKTCGDARIHQADALKFDFAGLSPGPGELRIVGNLPYNISTPLIFHLLESNQYIKDMHFMLQKEVVQRITAKPGTSAYGRLGIMVQYYCHADMLFTVAAAAFRPPPKVDSAIVRLVPHRTPPVDVEAGKFSRLVATAFMQRRKTLRNNLKNLLDSAHIESLGIDPGVRAETLTLEEFARLANALE